MPADAAAPDTTTAAKPQPPAPPGVPAPAGPGWPSWRYTGPPGRIYTAIPATVEPGDVLAWPQAPADDGCWEPTDDPATIRPDNHREG